jgi:hypothetical protein
MAIIPFTISIPEEKYQQVLDAVLRVIQPPKPSTLITLPSTPQVTSLYDLVNASCVCGKCVSTLLGSEKRAIVRHPRGKGHLVIEGTGVVVKAFCDSLKQSLSSRRDGPVALTGRFYQPKMIKPDYEIDAAVYDSALKKVKLEASELDLEKKRFNHQKVIKNVSPDLAEAYGEAVKGGSRTAQVVSAFKDKTLRDATAKADSEKKEAQKALCAPLPVYNRKLCIDMIYRELKRNCVSSQPWRSQTISAMNDQQLCTTLDYVKTCDPMKGGHAAANYIDRWSEKLLRKPPQ